MGQALGLAHGFKRSQADTLRHVETTGASAAQETQVGATTQGFSDVFAQGADVSSLAAFDIYFYSIKRFIHIGLSHI